tara:strand:+ start:341 stop:712 length:372 start_codon:yes stop_codon:yes gene_type:complete
MEFLLFALLVKHALADLFLQSFRPPGNKAPLFSKSNMLHSGDHGILTMFVFILFGYTYIWSIILGFIDFILHYTIDMSKTRFVRYMEWDRDGPLFWRLQAFDQIAHYATYILLIVLVSIYNIT